ncbi:MAG: D-alanine--D-alanine ligase [Proteobacteria bacterium]|nr:D-alanine--D-alanine ligase [Pseudomonadota bacterium]
MRIGLTYDLRSAYLSLGYSLEDTAEFDREETVDSIASACTQLGHQPVRIGNARDLVNKLAQGERWDLVFNICEGLPGPARESQVPSILDVYGIPYTFADPAVLALCLNKAWTKLVVANAGVPTPAHAVIECAADLALVDFPAPWFAKPLAEGTGKGITPISVINDMEVLASVSADLLVRYRQPVIVETYLPGREFTVSLLGTGADARVLGTLEIVLNASAEPGVYSYINKEECETRVEYRLVHPDDPQVARSEEVALASWRALGARDGGRVDLRCDADGMPSFIEVNPLAGLHPEHSDLPMTATAIGMSYVDLIHAIIESAQPRTAAVRQVA